MFMKRCLSPVLLAGLVSAGIFAQTPDRGEVNAFDRNAMFPYSKGLDVASEITQYAAFLAPAVFLAASPPAGYLGIGVMYAGSTVLAYGARTGLKHAVKRDRPYMYSNERNVGEIDDGDEDASFPSGHAIMAFSGAAFTATLFALRYPQSKLRTPVTVAVFAVAGTTAALRVASGEHFMSDVIAGALIGSFSGFIVPFAADRLGFTGPGGDSGLSVSPFGVSYKIGLK
jgi:membrane-associated phospholipid phosphatase